MPQVYDARTARHPRESPPHGDLQPSVMKRLVICQRWPYICFNMENRSRSIKRPVADPRMRKIKEAQEEQKLPNRVKVSPSRRQKTYKTYNSAVRLWVCRGRNSLTQKLAVDTHCYPSFLVEKFRKSLWQLCVAPQRMSRHRLRGRGRSNYTRYG